MALQKITKQAIEERDRLLYSRISRDELVAAMKEAKRKIQRHIEGGDKLEE